MEAVITFLIIKSVINYNGITLVIKGVKKVNWTSDIGFFMFIVVKDREIEDIIIMDFVKITTINTQQNYFAIKEYYYSITMVQAIISYIAAIKVIVNEVDSFIFLKLNLCIYVLIYYFQNKLIKIT